MTREYEPGPAIEVRGGKPPRGMYEASMPEYHLAREWWKAATKDQRRETTIDTLEWEFLSGIECWSITRQLINTGKIARDADYEARLERNREAVARAKGSA